MIPRTIRTIGNFDSIDTLQLLASISVKGQIYVHIKMIRLGGFIKHVLIVHFQFSGCKIVPSEKWLPKLNNSLLSHIFPAALKICAPLSLKEKLQKMLSSIVTKFNVILHLLMLQWMALRENSQQLCVWNLIKIFLMKVYNNNKGKSKHVWVEINRRIFAKKCWFVWMAP